MKIRSGFVANSSSVTFIVTNMTTKPIPLVEFFEELFPTLMSSVREDEYDYHVDRSIPFEGHWLFNADDMVELHKWITEDVYDNNYPNKQRRTLKPGKNELRFDDSGGLGGYFSMLDSGTTKTKRFKYYNEGRSG